MSPTEGVITQAKRYCLYQIDHQENYWNYHDPKTESSYPSSVPSRAQLSRFVLEGLERIMDEPFESVAACKKRISGIAIAYEEKFQPHRPIIEPQLGFLKKLLSHLGLCKSEKESTLKRSTVLQDTVQDFLSFITHISAEQIAQVEPLPYKRRLSEDESEIVRANFKKHWDFDPWGFEFYYWVPLSGASCSKPLLIFEDGDMNPYSTLNQIIFDLAPQRIYEIQENGIDYEMDASAFNADGREIAFAAKGYSWVVYSSHEGTLTIGGDWLRAEVEKQLGDQIKPENRVG